MTRETLENSWLVLFVLILLLCAYYYEVYVFLYYYIQTEAFNLPSEQIAMMYASLEAGDNLRDRLSALVMPLLVVFSATAYGNKLTKKTLALVAFFFILLFVTEYLIIQLRSDNLVGRLSYAKMTSNVFLKYLISTQDSLITFVGIVLGLSGINTVQEHIKSGKQEKSGEKNV